LLLAWPALAQQMKTVGKVRSSGPVTSEASRKIVSSLRGLIADFRAQGIQRGNVAAVDAAGRFSSNTLKVDGAGRVQVYISVTDTSDQALATLRGHGLDIEVVNKDFAIVQGWIPVWSLEALAGEPLVVKIRPPSYATTDTGSVVSQGDSIHRCNQARPLGFDGTGVRVGVVSDGVSGLAASQSAGELGPVQVLNPGSGDEGTAMLEIIADCAPGASLMFSTFGGSSLQFVQAVNALRAAGAQIIVDDVAAFLTEPIFEDSLTALNDRAVGRSLLRLTSAGNRGRAHYQAVFTPGSFDPDPQIMGTRHNFGGGDELLRFQVPGGFTVTLFLQWGNRFGAAADDYDLCIRLTNGALVACSNAVQNGDDDPLEFLSLQCPAASGSFCLADAEVTRFAGATQMLALFCSDPCQFTQFNNRSGSVVGHKAVPEVLAVSASPASNPGIVEDFSSAGPVTILFPEPQTRTKPDLNAVDGVATSRPGFNPFFGTSAAAPQAAAVAAIALQRMGPGTSPQALAGALKATAVDLGAAGFDADFGSGRADAVNVLTSPIGITLAAAVLPISRSVVVGKPATAFATMIASGPGSANLCTIAPPTSLPASFRFQTTNPATNQVTGTPNTPVNIPGGGQQTFVIEFTPTSAFAPTEVELTFTCANTVPAPVALGITTILLSGSAIGVPDIVALAAPLTNNGVANIPGPGGTGVFSVATVNLGVSGPIVASADTGGTALPVAIFVCQTNPATGVCISPPAPSVSTQIDGGATPTFAFFVAASGAVSFNPAANRAFVRFKDGGNVVRGSTSVAIQTQ
jgi:subtilase family protein